MLLKWLAYGFAKYFTNAWCWLDFLIVGVCTNFDNLQAVCVNYWCWFDWCSLLTAIIENFYFCLCILCVYLYVSVMSATAFDVYLCMILFERDLVWMDCPFVGLRALVKGLNWWKEREIRWDRWKKWLLVTSFIFTIVHVCVCVCLCLYMCVGLSDQPSGQRSQLFRAFCHQISAYTSSPETSSRSITLWRHEGKRCIHYCPVLIIIIRSSLIACMI